MPSVHPGVIIFCWVGVVVGLQVVGVLPLLVLLVAIAVLLDGGQRRRWAHLVRRSKWLILILTLTFFLSTPGEALSPGLPGSWEGLLAAVQHGGRFLLILAAVAWLLDANSQADLTAGLFCLAQPLRQLGWPTERAAARLALVFEYIGGDDERAGWRGLIEEAVAPDQCSIELELPSFRSIDALASGLGVALVFFSLMA